MARIEQDGLTLVLALLERLMARQSPGRPTFSALSRAMGAVRDAAAELRAAERAYGRGEAG